MYEDSKHFDIISKMPDSVLLHILSFLETRDVVKASLLSRRWSKLWVDVTTIDIDCRQGDPEHFVNFVDKYLELHNGQIKKFRVHFNSRLVQHSYVNSWINLLKTRNIEELEIDCSERDFSVGCRHDSGWYSICKSFFDCNLLKVLKLRECKMVPPTLKPFQHLTKVELDSVKFSDVDMTNNYFLESLIVKNCNHHGILDIKVPGSRFRHLEIADYALSDNTELKISSPYVSFLKIGGPLRRLYSMENFHHLEKVCLNATDFMHISRADRLAVLFEILESFVDCRTIVLSSSIIKALAFAITKHRLEGPSLNAVTLELESDLTKLDYWVLLHALKNFPRLESLIINICSDAWHKNDYLCSGFRKKNWGELDTLAVSAASGIRIVSMRNFLLKKFVKKFRELDDSGRIVVDSAEYPELATDKELIPVKLWLASCSNLEAINISTAKLGDIPRLEPGFYIYLKEKLDLLPKASQNVRIYIT